MFNILNILNIPSDSLQAKLLLLLVDKIIIGAIIAIVFFIYDSYKRRENYRIEKNTQEIQLKFEQAKLLKEFLPAINDKKNDIVTRGYLLRSAVITRSIDPEAAVEIGLDFYSQGLSKDHFKRIIKATLPESISTISKHGIELFNEWYNLTGEKTFHPTSTFDKVSGQERIPDQYKKIIDESRLWNSILRENRELFEKTELKYINETEFISTYLFGLYILTQTGVYTEAVDNSNINQRIFNIIGNIERLLFDGNDEEAIESLSKELLLNHNSIINIKLAREIMKILNKYGPPYGSIATSISKIIVEPKFSKKYPLKLREAQYWMKWDACDLLLNMNEAAKITLQNGAITSEDVLVNYLEDFIKKLKFCDSKKKLMALSNELESGKIIRRIIEIISYFNTDKTRKILNELKSIDENKLRAFPFLNEEISRAIEKTTIK